MKVSFIVWIMLAAVISYFIFIIGLGIIGDVFGWCDGFNSTRTCVSAPLAPELTAYAYDQSFTIRLVLFFILIPSFPYLLVFTTLALGLVLFKKGQRKPNTNNGSNNTQLFLSEKKQGAFHGRWKIYSGMVLSVLAFLYFIWAFFDDHIKTVAVYKCSDDSELHIDYRDEDIFPAAHFREYSFVYENGSEAILLGKWDVHNSLDNKKDYGRAVLPENTNIPVTVFRQPTSALYQVPISVFIPESIPKVDYEILTQCFANNLEKINQELIELADRLPEQIRDNYSPRRVYGVAHLDYVTLGRFKLNDTFTRGPDNSYDNVEINTYGAIFYDGEIIGTIFIGSPEIIQHPQKYVNYKNSEGENVIDFINRKRGEIGVISNESG